jgi:hypothetical protein
MPKAEAESTQTPKAHEKPPINLARQPSPRRAPAQKPNRRTRGQSVVIKRRKNRKNGIIHAYYTHEISGRTGKKMHILRGKKAYFAENLLAGT